MKVRDVIKRLQDDGWDLDRTKGSHRQFKHPVKAGLVTVSGKMNIDLPKGTLKSIWRQSQIQEDIIMSYAVVIEKGDTSYGAYVPDLPGCVAVGETLEEVESLIKEAIEFHLEGMQEQGLPIPEPAATVNRLQSRD